MKKFCFTWYKNEKYSTPIERKTEISSPVDDLASAAKQATVIFTKLNGSLKANTIVSIQEIDAEGNPIGEPIIPTEEEMIVPVKKK